jgi:hypothetical protein
MHMKYLWQSPGYAMTSLCSVHACEAGVVVVDGPSVVVGVNRSHMSAVPVQPAASGSNVSPEANVS